MFSDICYGDRLHKEYPQQFDKRQFWRQIKRTVNGEPVSEADIRLIVDQIVSGLDLRPHNHVLDLGCGNGALAGRFFAQVRSYTGVDFSRYLLDIAEEFFRPTDQTTYLESDIRNFDDFPKLASDTDKVLIYGCVAYLTKHETSQLLHKLSQNLPNLEKVFIGNVPNKLKAEEFFAARDIDEYALDNPQTPIGVWWEPGELLSIASASGFEGDCLFMPSHFYAAQYRFDAILTRSHRPPNTAADFTESTS